MGQMIDMKLLASIKMISADPSAKPMLVLGRADGAAAQVMNKLQAVQARFRIEEDLYGGLGEVAVDPMGWSVVVIVADDIGGLRQAQRAFGWLRSAAPGLRALIISSEVDRHIIPDGCRVLSPIVLRAPVSMLSLQLGIDTLLRDRTDIAVHAHA